MKRRILLIAFIIFQISISVFGQDSNKIKSKTEPKTDSIQFSEPIAYKMLYENQLASNDAILQTVFYALAGLGTAILLVIGGNWWFNTKKVEDLVKGIDFKIESSKETALAEVKEKIATLSSEKTSETNQIQIKLQEEVTHNIASLHSKFTEFSDKVREENTNLALQFEERIKIYSDNLSMQIKTIEVLTNERSEALNVRISELQTINSERIEAVNKDFKGREAKILDNLTKTERSLQASIYRNAAYTWEAKNVPTNAIMYFALEAKIHLEQKNTAMFDLSIDDIKRALENHIKEKLDDYRYGLINYIVDNAPPEQIEKINVIKALLKNNQML